MLLHDAVRPLVSQTIIAANVEALETYEAVDTAIPSADTVIEVDADERRSMTDVLPRHLLRRGQTPQSFRLSTIRAAYAKAAAGPELHRHRRLHGRAALPARGADRGRARARAQHEGHRADRRLHRRQAVPADLGRPARGAVTTRTTGPGSTGKTMVVFGGSYGIGGDIADLARAYGADGAHLLPLGHRHPRRAPRRHRRRGREVLAETGRIDFVVNTAGVLPRGRAGRDHRGDDLRRHRGQLPRADLHRPGVLPAPGRDARLAAAVHVVVLHPRPLRLLALLLGQGGGGQPDPGAGRRVGRGRASGSTASTRSGPARRCGPRPSARSRPAPCSPPRRWPASRSTCCCPARPGTSSTSAARTAPPRSANG